MASDSLLVVGNRVVVSLSVVQRKGEIKFIGKLKTTDADISVGIRLDTPNGKNDGSIGSTRYFKCEPAHGIFVRPSQVLRLCEDSKATDIRKLVRERKLKEDGQTLSVPRSPKASAAQQNSKRPASIKASPTNDTETHDLKEAKSDSMTKKESAVEETFQIEENIVCESFDLGDVDQMSMDSPLVDSTTEILDETIAKGIDCDNAVTEKDSLNAGNQSRLFTPRVALGAAEVESSLPIVDENLAIVESLSHKVVELESQLADEREAAASNESLISRLRVAIHDKGAELESQVKIADTQRRELAAMKLQLVTKDSDILSYQKDLDEKNAALAAANHVTARLELLLEEIKSSSSIQATDCTATDLNIDTRYQEDLEKAVAEHQMMEKAWKNEIEHVNTELISVKKRLDEAILIAAHRTTEAEQSQQRVQEIELIMVKVQAHADSLDAELTAVRAELIPLQVALQPKQEEHKVKSSEYQFDATEDDLNALVEDFRSKNQCLMEEVARQGEELMGKAEEIEALQERIFELEEGADGVQSGAFAEVIACRRQQKEAELYAAELEQELDTLRDWKHHYTVTIEAHRADMRASEHAKETAETRANELESTLLETTDKLSELNAKYVHANEQLEEAWRENEAAVAKCAELEKALQGLDAAEAAQASAVAARGVLEGRVARLEADLMSLKRDKERSDQRGDKALAELKKLREASEGFNNAKEMIQREKLVIEAELMAERNTLASNQQQLALFRAKLGETLSELKSVTAERAAALLDVHSLKQELELRREELEDLQRRCAAAEEIIQALKLEIEEKQAAYAGSQTSKQIAKLTAKSRMLQAELDELKESMEAQAGGHHEASMVVLTLQGDLSFARHTISTLSKRVEMQESTIQELNAKNIDYQMVEADLSFARHTISGLTEEITALQAQLRSLRQHANGEHSSAVSSPGQTQAALEMCSEQNEKESAGGGVKLMYETAEEKQLQSEVVISLQHENRRLSSRILELESINAENSPQSHEKEALKREKQQSSLREAEYELERRALQNVIDRLQERCDDQEQKIREGENGGGSVGGFKFFSGGQMSPTFSPKASSAQQELATVLQENAKLQKALGDQKEEFHKATIARRNLMDELSAAKLAAASQQSSHREAEYELERRALQNVIDRLQERCDDQEQKIREGRNGGGSVGGFKFFSGGQLSPTFSPKASSAQQELATILQEKAKLQKALDDQKEEFHKATIARRNLMDELSVAKLTAVALQSRVSDLESKLAGSP